MMSTPGSIRLEVPDLVHAVPGGPFEFDVRVTHLETYDTSVLVRVVGALVGLEPARVIDLPAGQPVTTAVRMALPDGMSPGQYRVVVEVVERSVGQVVEASEVTVSIARTRGVTITMTPETVSRRRRGKYRAMIRNHDDVEQRLKLKPVPDRLGLTLAVSPEEVTLGPGESVVVGGRVTMKGFWVGQFRERWFTLLGETSGASVYGRGLVLQKPIISRSITRLVALIAVLAVWLTGTLVVMRLLDPVTDDAATGAEAAVDPGADGPTIPFGEGETKATITVTGAVTAVPDGSAVTVLYRPVTLADIDASEGKATPTAEETEVAGLRTETGPDGAFEVAGLEANGIYEFRFAKAGHNTLTRLVQPNGADVTLEVTLEVGSGVISGTVVGPLGGPRGGVTVTLSDGAITYTTSTPSSGPDAGRFTFNNLSTPGTYVLDARATGFGLASTVVELESGGVRQDVVLQISPDIGVLSGRVTSTAFETLASVDQLPARGIMITATDGTITRTTSTLSEGDLAGTFRLVGLPLGRTYTVSYVGEGYSPRTELVDFTAATEPLEVSLIPSTGRVRGTITTPPETVSPAAVAVTLASPENTYKSTDAISADGDLLLTGIAPGTYVAIFQSTGLADQVRDVTVSAGQTSQLDVDMERPVDGLGFGTIVVALTDAASLEALTADVTMRFRAGGCGSVGGGSGTCTWVAAGGALTITNLEAGAYTLGFSQVGYRPDLTTVEVTPGQTVPVVMALQPLGSVQGIVQDSDGGALQGVNLILYEANADDTAGKQVATARVNDKGEYRFRRVMFSRNYVLSATLSGYSSVLRPITGAVASTVNLDITLRSESQIAGQLQTLDLVSGDTDPVSLDDFTVYLRTGPSTSAWVDMLPQGLVRTLGGYRFGVTPNKIEGVTTSASAKYAICIQRNLEGRFDPALCNTGTPEFVQVFDDDGLGIEILQGELKVRSATFTPYPASVSGVVRLPNNATVPEGTAVELRRVDFDNKVLDTFTTVTDVNGRFGFENMAPTTTVNGFKPPTPQPNNDGTATVTGSASSWRIQVRSENGSYNGLRFDLGPNAKYDMDVRMLEGTGSLEFFMMDDFGLPIEDVVIYVMKTSTGAQNVDYDDLRYLNADGSDRCGNLPGQDRFGTDIALTANVAMRGCTGSGGSLKFEVLSAPVQYYVAIGMSDRNGFAEILKQVIPVRVGIDAVEARSLRQTWYYGDINVLVDAADPDRVPTSQLVNLANQGKLTIRYELIATASATPVPTNNSLKCYRENVYLWQVPTPTVTEGLTPDGECYINDMRPGTYRVTAVLSDPVTQKILQTTTSAVAIVQPGREKAVVPIIIPVIQRELQVRVIDGANNTTVSGATVVVGAANQPPVATKSTGNDGSVTFSSTAEELPPAGIVFVTVGYPGFATTSASLSVRSGEQQTMTVSLATSVAEAKIAVVDVDGRPITGANVTIDGVPATEGTCTAPLTGWYCLRNISAGIATVVVTKTGYRTMTVPMAVANPGGGTATVVLVATTGTLFVDAVDAATGAAIDLSTYTVSISDLGASAYNATTKTFGGVTPGVVQVSVVPPGGSVYARVTISATVTAGTTTSATVRLNRVSDGLVVTVVDSLGNAISGATVTAGTSGALGVCAGGVTNRYCWTSASPGVVSVSASAAGYSTVLLYTTVDGNGTGSVSLVLRQLTGNLLVSVVDSVTGAPVAVSSSNVTVSATVSGCTTAGLGAGQCRFDGLSSVTTYTVAVSGLAGHVDATVSSGVPLDGQTGTVVVQVRPRLGTLFVEGVDAGSGAAVALDPAKVRVVGQPGLVYDAVSQSFQDVVPGVVSIAVDAQSGYAASTVSASVAPGATTAATVRLNRTADGLVVTVVDSLGNAISGATVTAGTSGALGVCAGGVTNRYCLSGVSSGVVSVSASASGYTTVEVFTTITNDGTGSVSLVLRQLTGNLLVSVVDSVTGAPVAVSSSNVTVSATVSGCTTAGLGAGQCRFDGLSSVTTHTVTVSDVTGYRTATVSAGVPLDGQTGTITVYLVASAAEVRVQVFGPGGAALTGATVTVDNQTLLSASCAAPQAGVYCSSAVEPGLRTLIVVLAGYATATQPIAVAANGAAVTLTLVPDTAPLRVRVIDQTGATVTSPTPSLTVSVASTAVTMTACGDQWCGDAPTGIASVTVSASGYTTVEVLTAVGDQGGAVAVVIRKTSGNLLVSLVDDATGLPIDFASSLTSVTLGASAPECTFYDSGRCLFSGVAAGVVTVSVSSLSGYNDASASASVLIGDQTTTVNLRMSSTSTTGTVVLVVGNATNGQPITTGLTVTASNSALAAPPAVDTAEANLGRYSLAGFANGLWTVTLSAEGFVTRLVTVRVQAGVNTEFSVEMSSNAYSLTGYVAVAVGGTATSALAAATVTLSAGATTLTSVTDALGRYTFSGVTAGAWTVAVSSTWATANGYTVTATSSASVDLTSDGATVTQDLVVDAKAGGLALTVLAATGAPASSVDVWVDLDRDGVRDSGEEVASNGSGLATLSAVPAGVYQIVLSDGQQRYATTSALVLVERNLTSSLTFRLASWGVTVTVGVEIVPIAGLVGEPTTVWVRLVGASSTLTAVSTVSNGALSLAAFENVPADTYAIELSADNTVFVGEGGSLILGGVTYVVPDLEDITVGANGFDVDAGMISLARATVTVTVSVVDNVGNSVNGAQVGVSGASLLTQRTAFTTTSGEAILVLPADATFSVSAALAGYGSTSSALTTAAVDTTVLLELAPDVAMLRVFAVDASSPTTTVTTSRVEVEEFATGIVTVEIPGMSVYAGFEPGGYRVTVSAAGYVDYVTSLTLAVGEMRTLTAPMQAVAATTASVTVSAVNAASPGTSVTPTSAQLTRLSTGQVLTPDGNFAFHDITPGAYRVSVSATGFVDYVSSFSVVAGEQLTVTAAMTSNEVGGVMVSLRSTAGSTVDAVSDTIYLVDSAGSVRNDCVVQPSAWMCAFAGVPTGPYSVTVSASGYNGFESISVSTGVTTSATVVVNFTASAWILVTTSAEPVMGAVVTADGTGQACTTPESGICELVGLDPSATLVFRVSGTTNFNQVISATRTDPPLPPATWDATSSGSPYAILVVLT